MGANGTPIFTTIGIYVVIAALLIYRYSRPMKTSVARMFVAPIVMLAMTCLSIYGEQQLHPSPPLGITLALIAGGLLGIPMGMLRARHTGVRATDRPGVMYLDASWIVLAVWLGAFVVRAILRAAFHNGTTGALLGDGLLAFAMMTVIASYIFIFRKYKALEIQAGQI